LRALCTASVAATAVAASVIISAPATADPRLTIRQVEAKVHALEEEAEHAAERANALHDEVAAIQRGLSRSRKDVAAAQKRVDDLRELLGQVANAQYQNGGIDPTLELLLTGDASDVLGRASSLDQLARSQSQSLQRIAAAQNSLEQATAALDSQLARLRSLQAKQAAEKATIDRSVGAAQRLLSTLKAEERARLAAIEKARREAAIREAAEREAARRQAAARSTRSETRESNDGNRSRTTTTTTTRKRDGGNGGGGAPAYNGPSSGRAGTAVSVALAQVGDSYVYGGNGPSVFDCSGLTTFAWRAAGVSLPRSSSSQYAAGRKVSKSSLQPGDLVYYYSPISHVGMYIGGGRIVHAANPRSGVNIAPLDSMPYVGATRP
jgi:cell wall-associated NlpC family hydrolase